MSAKTNLSVRHMLPSAILSAADDPGKPTKAMIDLALRAAQLTLETTSRYEAPLRFRFGAFTHV